MTSKKAICKLKGETPLTFGKFHQTPRLPKELDAAYEERTWRERLHCTKEGDVYICRFMIANAIRESAKFLSLPVPGKGKSTFTKHFASIIPNNDIDLGIHKDDVPPSMQHVPSDGSIGGTRRVIKYFPIIHEWSGTIEILIPDNIITSDVFEEVVINAGELIGIGTWRPRNRGMNGRFKLVDMQWVEKLK